MKNFMFAAIFLTSYFVSARISDIKPNENQVGFESLKDAQRKSDVNKDIQDLIDLVPRDKIQAIVENWIAKDEEVKNNWNYISSKRFKQKLLDVENSPEFIVVKQRLGEVYVDLPRFINQVYETISIKSTTINTDSNALLRTKNTGLRGMFDEIRPEIPIAKMILKAGGKYIISPQFRPFFQLLRNKDFKKAMKDMTHNQQVTDMIDDMKINKVDLQALADFYKNLSPLFEDSVPQI